MQEFFKKIFCSKKLKFNETQVNIEEFYSSVEDKEIIVTIETYDGQQVAEFILDLAEFILDLAEFKTSEALSQNEESSKKLLGFILLFILIIAVNLTTGFTLITGIKNFDFFQQFNIFIGS